jgi:hypothetical protein
LDYEINSNLHENLNVFQNDKHLDEYVDDCDNKDNNENSNRYEQLEIQDTNSDILEEYVNVNHDDEIMESNSDIISDDNLHDEESIDDVIDDVIDESDVGHSKIVPNEDDEELDEDIIENDNDGMSFDEEEDANSEEMYETKSFHSEEVGDVDSVDSKELFISHFDNEEKYNISPTNEFHNTESNSSEVKNIIIGENVLNYHEDVATQIVNDKDGHHQTDIKVIHIDDNKSKLSSKKDALLSIKKKVKSSMHHSREKKHDNQYERYGDRIQVERKNMSFF